MELLLGLVFLGVFATLLDLDRPLCWMTGVPAGVGAGCVMSIFSGSDLEDPLPLFVLGVPMLNA